jgi:proline racemase
VVHPELPGVRGIAYAMLTDRRPNGEWVGATVMPPGRIDRSPCGTGNSARMAVMYERGEVTVGQTYVARSVIDSSFDVSCLGTAEVAGHPAVLVRVTGRGWIHGLHQIGIDPDDPYPLGYSVSDCWGDAFDLVN